jgi:pSer/pThr/pTyr-binding forkhead associated (FHA) protein
MLTSDVLPVRLVSLGGWSDIVVGRTFVVIGRHPRCDVQLDSAQVSRRHCFLTAMNGELLVRDLGSRNGSWINGRQVKSGRLLPGDTLSIAHLHFRMEGGPEHEVTLRASSAGSASAGAAPRDRSAMRGGVIP